MSAALIRATMRPRCTFGSYYGGRLGRCVPMGMSKRTYSFSATSFAFVGMFGTSIISSR